ncbi:hypothetical protein HAX54_033748 [Datura stramonium]|uniref:UDP-glycosyltransferases domain-containing protein n=1 Tax=Datura stramonium TaxID=4076 RepID=A0ABS8VCT5_DATST|nr:hypothetical protein [Datura stramonium]
MSIFSSAQLLEIAIALEASDQQFIWVVKQNTTNEEQDEWMPEGFEEKLEGRGLIIKGWAPQVLILDHAAIGGFVTHCGWNSLLEGVTAGVPMVTWPLSAEQFFNEKLLVEILKIGVPEAEEMRGRAAALGDSAKMAVEKGGSSDNSLVSLLEELRRVQQSSEETISKNKREYGNDKFTASDEHRSSSSAVFVIYSLAIMDKRTGSTSHSILSAYDGSGHMIPLVDIARQFARLGVKATIITTPLNASKFSKIIQRDRELGSDISIRSGRAKKHGTRSSFTCNKDNEDIKTCKEAKTLPFVSNSVWIGSIPRNQNRSFICFGMAVFSSAQLLEIAMAP